MDGASLSASSADSRRHLVYVLLDSNLPTGGFVASSGLESYAKHGHIDLRKPTDGLLRFTKESLTNYAGSTLSFVQQAWYEGDANHHGSNAVIKTSEDCRTGSDVHGGQSKRPAGVIPSDRNSLIANDDALSLLQARIAVLCALDSRLEAQTLNQITRRSSVAQGIAMLTLFTKGLSSPAGVANAWLEPKGTVDAPAPKMKDFGTKVVDEFKRKIRKDETPGHLAVCWGLIAGSLGLDLAVRLNLIGPYASTQLLLHPAEKLVEGQIHHWRQAQQKLSPAGPSRISDDAGDDDDDDWSWADEKEGDAYSTWPLGELVMARHDLQHTRIFNS